MARPFKIIDLFAGPGGLGEGFSGFNTPDGARPFRISASIEKEASAHRTLLLRAFYRQFDSAAAPKEYYDFLAGNVQYKQMLGTGSNEMSWTVIQRDRVRFRIEETARALRNYCRKKTHAAQRSKHPRHI